MVTSRSTASTRGGGGGVRKRVPRIRSGYDDKFLVWVQPLRRFSCRLPGGRRGFGVRHSCAAAHGQREEALSPETGCEGTTRRRPPTREGLGAGRNTPVRPEMVIDEFGPMTAVERLGWHAQSASPSPPREGRQGHIGHRRRGCCHAQCTCERLGLSPRLIERGLQASSRRGRR